MSFDPHDTIVAIATAPLGAARGIVRLSGPGVIDALARCVDPWIDGQSLATPPHSSASRRVPATAQVCTAKVRLDEPRETKSAAWLPCDVFYWPEGRSYTRQCLVELHTFGSPPLLEAALQTLCRAGARLAEPGEFTLRAFLAGRLDLTQAEAVLGVVDAVSQRQLDVALGQLAGGLAEPLGQLRDRLLDLLAHLEAGLDFVEEGIEFVSRDQLQRQLGDANELVRAIVGRMQSRGLTSGPPRVVLRGAPNVGKSSLLNALSDRPEAIVSHAPGTTRDYLSVRLELTGAACQLIDTAGVEEGEAGSIDEAAQVMTDQQRQQADVELLCLDASRPLQQCEQAWLCESIQRPRIVVWTKTDLSSPPEGDLNRVAIATSSRTGAGLDQLRLAIARTVAQLDPESSVVRGTAARCREGLQQADESLERAAQLAAEDAGEELVAAEIRVALDSLGNVVGAIYTDDLLDRIFSRFCIGK